MAQNPQGETDEDEIALPERECRRHEQDER